MFWIRLPLLPLGLTSLAAFHTSTTAWAQKQSVPALGNQVRDIRQRKEGYCDGLNRYGPDTLMCSHAWHHAHRGGTIRSSGLVGVDVSLWRWALRTFMLKVHPVWQSLLAAWESR